jgi:hypothetical protein
VSDPWNSGTRLYRRIRVCRAAEARPGRRATGRERHRLVPQRFATRAFRQTSLIVDPPDGSMPTFTAEAQKRRASRDRGTFGEGPMTSFSIRSPWTTR